MARGETAVAGWPAGTAESPPLFGLQAIGQVLCLTAAVAAAEHSLLGLARGPESKLSPYSGLGRKQRIYGVIFRENHHNVEDHGHTVVS